MHLRTSSSLAIAVFIAPSAASYAFYVGSGLTTCNCVMVGGTGEEVSSHWMQLFPAADHSENATISVGATANAILPGRITTIPQAKHTWRYASMEYSEYLGFPAPLSNGGLNEKGVAVRAVWAPSRQALVETTPNPQIGLQYSDLSKVVLQRASSAREGVEIIGQMIQEYGDTTYGGNTHLVADKDEGWVVWEFGGAAGLWAAERLGPDQIRVLYPGYIEDFPLDFQDRADYMGSPNLISYARDKGWWTDDADGPFNILKVYGLQPGEETPAGGNSGYVTQAQLEKDTLAMVPLTEKDLMERVRDPRISNDAAGYGQVASLVGDTDPDMFRLWIAPTSSVTAPFIPWWLGVQSVPAEYGQHRYLTQGSSSTFLKPDYELQEASLFAGRLYKRLLYYACSAPRLFLPVVRGMLQGFENASFADIEWVEKTAKLLISQGERELAHNLLTDYSHTRAREALALGTSMVNFIDSYVKLTGRWTEPKGDMINTSPNSDPVRCVDKSDSNEVFGFSELSEQGVL